MTGGPLYRLKISEQERTVDGAGDAREIIEALEDHHVGYVLEVRFDQAADPVPDADGDLKCPECPRIFATRQALAVHRARAHGVKGARR